MYKLLKENKVKLIYIPFILYWITLFIMTTIPSSSLPEFDVSDKINHLVAYLILALFMSLTLHFQEKYKLLSEKALTFSFIIGTTYGILDELHQSLIPGRYCDFADWVANVIGIIIGIIITKIIFLQNKNLRID